MIVRAIDQDAAHASIAHLSEGDLLWAGHGASRLLQLLSQHFCLWPLEVGVCADSKKFDRSSGHGLVNQEDVIVQMTFCNGIGAKRRFDCTRQNLAIAI